MKCYAGLYFSFIIQLSRKNPIIYVLNHLYVFFMIALIHTPIFVTEVDIKPVSECWYIVTLNSLMLAFLNNLLTLQTKKLFSIKLYVSFSQMDLFLSKSP